VTRFGVVVSLLLIACRPASGPAGDAPLRVTITETLARHTDGLLAIPGVVGVGEGQLHGDAAVQVLVVRRTPELERRLPSSLEGYPVHVVETGVIEAQPDS
jgi:hypothetical protein